MQLSQNRAVWNNMKTVKNILEMSNLHTHFPMSCTISLVFLKTNNKTVRQMCQSSAIYTNM